VIVQEQLKFEQPPENDQALVCSGAFLWTSAWDPTAPPEIAEGLGGRRAMMK